MTDNIKKARMTNLRIEKIKKYKLPHTEFLGRSYDAIIVFTIIKNPISPMIKVY